MKAFLFALLISSTIATNACVDMDGVSLCVEG